MNDAVRHAVELKAFGRAERAKIEHQGLLNATYVSLDDTKKPSQNSELTSLKHAVEKIEQAISKMNYLPSTPQSKDNNQPRYKGSDRQQKNYNNRPKRKGKRTCFECGSEDHIRPSCPKLKFQKDTKSQNEPSTVSNVGGNGCGLFLGARLGDKNLNCLIDTVASGETTNGQSMEAS